MSKSKFKTMLKHNIERKAVCVLEGIKAKHSKVMNIKHGFLRMQTYLMPSPIQITKEERQLVFQLRSEMTNVKMNFKGMYSEFECEICEKENETQKHMLECKELLQMENNEKNVPEYEKLFNGNVKEKIEIARKFKQNMKIRENVMKRKRKELD